MGWEGGEWRGLSRQYRGPCMSVDSVPHAARSVSDLFFRNNSARYSPSSVLSIPLVLCISGPHRPVRHGMSVVDIDLDASGPPPALDQVKPRLGAIACCRNFSLRSFFFITMPRSCRDRRSSIAWGESCSCRSIPCICTAATLRPLGKPPLGLESFAKF